MRTHLPRLTTAAATAVLTGVSLAGVAHAKDVDDANAVLDPSVLEALEPCDELSVDDLMLYPIDPDLFGPDEFDQDDFMTQPGDDFDGWVPPTGPDDPDTEKPWGDLVPCYQVPTDPGDDDGQDPGDDGNDDDGQDHPGGNGDDDGQQPGGTGGNGGSSGGGQGDDGSDGQPSGEQPSGGAQDEDSGEGADEPSSQPQQANATPTAATGDDGNGSLMLAVLAGALGALGLLLLIFGFRKRPRRGYQPAR